MAESPIDSVDALADAARRGDAPPPQLSRALRVLWLEASGAWDAAHDLATEMPDPDGAILHAYLHRVEGDLGNAGYWYRRAGETPFEGATAAEWHALAERFFGQS